MCFKCCNLSSCSYVIIKKNLIVIKFFVKGLWGVEWIKYCMVYFSVCKEEDI